MLKKVPVREQDPKVRATNFEEVCLGYNQEEAMEEAQRCLGCKKPKCVEGCPVSINIPGFIEEIKEGKIEEAYKVIGLSSALPAICGRVCPQESQCEGKCIRGVKGEAVSIGKLERFVADYALEHDIKPVGAEVKNGHKVAVIGSGPSGLTCAGDLAKAGYDVTVFEALHELGGVLVYGIPEFRLPKQKVVKKEIEKVKELGVKFETNVVIGKSTTIDQLIEDEGFEAVFIGSGAGLPMFMGIPGENAYRSTWFTVSEKITWIYFFIALLFSVNAVLNSVGNVLMNKEQLQNRPMKGFIQIFQVIFSCVAIIVIISILINKSPLNLITGLGAFAAVLMLIFKDTILGFVAGYCFPRMIWCISAIGLRCRRIM